MKKNNLPAAALSVALAVAMLAGPGIHIAHAQYSTISAPAASSATSFSFLSSGPLSTGSRGTDVAGLQGLLSELGYLSVPTGTPLGYFGTMTRNALMNYQRVIGAPATGEFDASTRAATVTYLTSRFPQISFAWSGFGGQAGSQTGTLASNAPTTSGRPLSSTGYWYNGNWYNSIPSGNNSGVTGYWLNGTWYTVSGSSTSTSSGTIASNSGSSGNTGSGMGYWYNGAWYPVSSTQGGGYYSSGPNTTASSGPSGGYWYNGVWYPASTANIGGGQSSDTNSGGTTRTSGGSGQTQNGINYSSNLTPTGYWLNGTWYAFTPSTSQAQSLGIPGYWQNNVWQSIDGSQTTSYGTPNPTNPNSGSGYWMNGVWYSTSVNSSNNTSGTSY